MRMDEDSRLLGKSPRRCHAKRLQHWSALAFFATTLGACGATRHERPGDGHEIDGNGARSSQGGSGTGALGNGGSAAAGDGSGASNGVFLTGTPKYFRFVRLTNPQWAASVQEVLKLTEPSGLEQVFPSPLFGTTDFSNNELLLDVNSRAWQEFQTAAEALAAQVTASDDALATIYAGTDSEGFIKTVGRRAYRRPLTANEVRKCTALFETGATMPGPQSAFAKGAALVIRALLQSPHFLYRTELGATGEALNGYEAAAKLSLLLRGSTPNDALLDEADALSDPDVFVDHASRMLGEATATGVMRQFHGELLHFARFKQVSKVETPGYEPSLNAELEESSFLFFDKIFTAGLGVREILTSTRGFVSKGMAPLYGLQPEGSGFVEQELGPLRVGYFSQLPQLILHAHNQQPDALHRGLSLALDVLCSSLGSAVSEIPPIPPLQPGQTSRQRIDALTGACGGTCHREIMNPLGFAFEHFDGMGQYRDTEASGLPIDSSGSFTFSDGQVDFADHVELMAAMASRPNAHVCYAKKLASFALQRDIVASDRPWLTELANLSQDAGGTRELMLQLIQNDAFRTHAGGTP
jgi:hypothetical protein